VATASDEFDFRALLGELTSFAKNRGSALRDQLRSVKPDENAIALSVLVAIENEPKNLKEIADSIAMASGGAWKPGDGLVLSRLTSLVEAGQAQAHNEGERRIYSITESGKNTLESARNVSDEVASEPEATAGAESAFGKFGQAWPSCDPAFLITASKLGPVLLDLAQTGDRAQQAKAAEVIEAARKQLHVILAAD